MPRPLLLAVDADPEALSRIEAHLQRRFGADFRVRGELTAAAALAPARDGAEAGRPGRHRAGRPVAARRVRAPSCWAGCARCTRTRDGRCWCPGAPGRTARPRRRSCARWRIGRHQLLRAQAVVRARRAVPPHRRASSSRSGRAPSVSAPARGRRRGGAARGAGARHTQPADPQRHPARLPRAGLRPRPVRRWRDRHPASRGADRTRRGVDAGARRHRAARPDRRRDLRGVGHPTDARSEDERDFDVLVVGAGPAGLAAAVYASSEGLTHAGRRARVARRPGRVELADPQLPRLLARGQRRRAGPARLPAGVGLRRPLRADPRGRPSIDPEGRPVRRATSPASATCSARGRGPRDRRRLPPARRRRASRR